MKSKFLMLYILFFFFQAEDGIRDGTVTGVQTCALPISVTSHQCAPPSERWGRPTVSGSWMMFTLCRRACTAGRFAASSVKLERSSLPPRSEERRVGKECRARGGAEHGKERRYERR